MSEVTTRSAGDVVRQFYAFVAEGDQERASELLDENVLVHEPATLPWGGEYQGRDGMGQLVSVMHELAVAENVGGFEYIEAGDTVILRTGGRYTSRATGQAAESEIIEIVKVRDGKLADVDVYYRDPSSIAAAMGPRRAE